MRLRAAPFDAIGDAERARRAHRASRSSGPPPMCARRQCRFARQQRERVQEVVESFLVDGAADRQQRRPDAPDREPSRLSRRAWRGRGSARVDAVIDEVDRAPASPARSRRCSRVDRRARRRPRARRELLALLPLGSRPDVLRMRRAAPRQPAHQRGVARDRRRRVQEMRVQVRDVRRQLGGQHQRLAEPAHAVARRNRGADRATRRARASR